MRGLQLYQNQLFNGFICRTLYYVYVDKTGFISLLETFFPTNEGTL